MKFSNSDTTTLDAFTVFTLSNLKSLLPKISKSIEANDVVPTRLCKIVLTSSPDYFIALIKFTLQKGYFQNQFKQGVVKPLMKKSYLDPELLSSHRPLTNLRFKSKLLKELFLSK